MNLEQIQLASRFGTQDALKDKLGLIIFIVVVRLRWRFDLVGFVHVVDGFGHSHHRLVAVETGELLGVAPCWLAIDNLLK